MTEADMVIIEKLTELIGEEMEDAQRYAELALKWKDDYPGAAEVAHRLAGEETEHAKALHGAAAALIEEHRKTEGDPPAALMAVYNYLHGKQVRKAAEVQALRQMYGK